MRMETHHIQIFRAHLAHTLPSGKAGRGGPPGCRQQGSGAKASRFKSCYNTSCGEGCSHTGLRLLSSGSPAPDACSRSMGARLGGGAVGWISAPLVPGPGDLCLWTTFMKVIIKWRDETCVSDGPVVVGKISGEN